MPVAIATVNEVGREMGVSCQRIYSPRYTFWKVDVVQLLGAPSAWSGYSSASIILSVIILPFLRCRLRSAIPRLWQWYDAGARLRTRLIA